MKITIPTTPIRFPLMVTQASTRMEGSPTEYEYSDSLLEMMDNRTLLMDDLCRIDSNCFIVTFYACLNCSDPLDEYHVT